MNKIMIDDDDFEVTEENISDNLPELKATLVQGVKDLKEIVELLNKLSPLMEPFGESDTINELVILYSEIIPDILIGDYSYALEGLDGDDKEIARLALNRRRKDIVSNLLEKYNK